MLDTRDDQQVYLTGVTDQLGAAVAHGDADTADKILDQVDADGYPDAAAALTRAALRTSIGDQLAEPSLSTDDPGGPTDR